MRRVEFRHHSRSPHESHFWHHLLETSDTTCWTLIFARSLGLLGSMWQYTEPNPRNETQLRDRVQSCKNVYYSIRVSYLTLHVAVTVQSQIISIGSSQSFTHARTEVSLESPLNASLTSTAFELQLTSTVNRYNCDTTSTELTSTVNWTSLIVRAIIILEPTAQGRLVGGA